MNAKRPLILAALLFLAPLSASAASSASLFMSSPESSPEAGSVFDVQVMLASPGDEAVNAASGTISFPPGILEVQSIDAAGSVFDIWAGQPSVSNQAGDVSFAGVALNPGFTGNRGLVMTIRFKALAAGPAPISFASGSILANDGKGTSLPVATSSLDVEVEPSGAVSGADVGASNPAAAPAPGWPGTAFEISIFAFLAVIVAISVFTNYRLNRLERKVPPGMSPKDAEALRKLKKDIHAVEDEIDGRMRDE